MEKEALCPSQALLQLGAINVFWPSSLGQADQLLPTQENVLLSGVELGFLFGNQNLC